LAPSKNGQKYVAVIDGISQDRVAITFIGNVFEVPKIEGLFSYVFLGNGVKHMVHHGELSTAPVEDKKSYIFQSSKPGVKKDWQAERERRKIRAQKKEQRRKTLDETKEQEKNKWKNFNAKASQKQLRVSGDLCSILHVNGCIYFQGLKRVEATGSAADGGKEAPERKAVISSRKDNQLGRTQRGNMDSLF